jgi:hypothetical protein
MEGIRLLFPIASHLPSIVGTGKLKWMTTKNYKKIIIISVLKNKRKT